MKTLKIVLCFLLIGLTLSACSSPKSTNKWDKAEMADIADPGFTIVSKSKNSNEIKYLFKDVEVAAANTFLTLLYASEFDADVNYSYDASFYSYSAKNSAGKSISFEYSPIERTASFTYALSGSSTFVVGVRDMGYLIKVNFEKDLDSDYKNYTAWLYYSINLNVKLTNQTDTLVSCAMKDVSIKSPSRVGSFSISNDVYNAGSSTYTKTCASLGTWDMGFIVRQKAIGKYPASTPYAENQKAYFDLMALSQADLMFVVAFDVEIQTNKGMFTKSYEIQVLPSGSDVTVMSKFVLEIDKRVTDLSKGIHFTKSN